MEVAVLGAGYAGIAATRRLERVLPRGATIELFDESGIHEIQHEIHRVIRFPELAAELRLPAAELVDRATVTDATVTAVDPAGGRIETLGGEGASPDHVIVCLGAVTAEYGIPGVGTHGQPCKSVADAAAIREAALTMAPGGRVVVAGAGLSGVQIAGELAELLAETDPEGTVTLLEQADAVAPRFPSRFGEAIRNALLELGVDVQTSSTVAGVGATEVQFEAGEPIEYDHLVWTGGIRGPDAISGERWRVDADLRAGPNTFVAGDAATVVDDHGNVAPAAAQTAVRQGRLAADNVSRLVRGADEPLVFEPRLARYDYDPPGWFVSVGDRTVGMVGDRVVTGAAAEAAKATVGAGYLTSIGAVDAAIDRIRRTVREHARPGDTESGNGGQ